MEDILKVENLSLSFYTSYGENEAVKDVSFLLRRGEILGIVGESGCGKSILCKGITKLIPPIAKIKTGCIKAEGVDITAYNESKMSRMRGSFFAYVFQNPMTALNPTLTVGAQIAEAVRLHDERNKQGVKAHEKDGKSSGLGKEKTESCMLQNDSSKICEGDYVGDLCGNNREQFIAKTGIRERVIRLLELVGIDHPDKRIDMYPHEFSGGMRQRAVIAMALAAEPKVIFADEPTTALDEHIGEQILKLFDTIRKSFGTSIVFVSHDIEAVRKIADRIAVMYDGRIVESGSTEEIFEHHKHPYTRLLLDARKRLIKDKDFASIKTLMYHEPDADSRINTVGQRKAQGACISSDDLQTDLIESQMQKGILLHIEKLNFSYQVQNRNSIKALRDISLDIRRGEIFGIIGASGSGKSTLAGCIMNIHKPDEGRIIYKDIDLGSKQAQKRNKSLLKQSRQLIFQDSSSSLNPRMKIADIIAEPTRLANIRLSRENILSLMQSVGLSPEYADKFPSELSGGERQRAAIARAVSVRPELIIADEALASLDAPIQSQIVSLFKKMQREYGFTLIFISHDMEMVRYLCDRAAVLEHGELVRVESYGWQH